jgi:hypothetical protein
LPDSAVIMPFNQNPRAVNYYKKDSMDSKSIFSFANQGDPQFGLQAVEYYSSKVKNLMFHDTFLAFSNITKDLNNPEIMERINEKMTMLGPAVGRYLSEVLNPIVQRTIGILWRRGRLPKPPDEMIMDPSYEIDFVGTLAQAQRRSELNTLITGLTMMGQMAQFTPEIMDKINPDKVTDEVWAITGASVKVLRDDAEIKKIREGRAEASMKAQEMAMAPGLTAQGLQQQQAGLGLQQQAAGQERNWAQEDVSEQQARYQMGVEAPWQAVNPYMRLIAGFDPGGTSTMTSVAPSATSSQSMLGGALAGGLGGAGLAGSIAALNPYMWPLVLGGGLLGGLAGRL